MDNIAITPLPKPEWLRVKAPTGPGYQRLRELITKRRLHTVCSSASCPNMGECWEHGTATFMILGNICTRACRFCDVNSYDRPKPVDLGEPERLAHTIQEMGLSHAVITSVTRDDLPDGGAAHFQRCLHAIFAKAPHVTLEVLVPDFSGNPISIDMVLASALSIYNHNIETTKRLTPRIRSGARYEISLETLRYAKQKAPHILTKSGIMLGLGEDFDEVKEAIYDLHQQKVDILTIGQYLRPSPWHHEVKRYAALEEFEKLGDYARALGFHHVESGPLVRSSYHAHKAIKPVVNTKSL